MRSTAGKRSIRRSFSGSRIGGCGGSSGIAAQWTRVLRRGGGGAAGRGRSRRCARTRSPARGTAGRAGQRQAGTDHLTADAGERPPVPDRRRADLLGLLRTGSVAPAAPARASPEWTALDRRRGSPWRPGRRAVHCGGTQARRPTHPPPPTHAKHTVTTHNRPCRHSGEPTNHRPRQHPSRTSTAHADTHAHRHGHPSPHPRTRTTTLNPPRVPHSDTASRTLTHPVSNIRAPRVERSRTPPVRE